jgi:Cu-Zn family superoxide dismutase
MGQDSKMRHAGDLGNLVTDARGCAKYRFSDPMIKLRGTKSNIIGRGLIIHADEDDCSQGGDATSLANVLRVQSLVIGLLKNLDI